MAKNIKQQNLPACYITWVIERKRRQTVMEIRFPGAATVPYDDCTENFLVGFDLCYSPLWFMGTHVSPSFHPFESRISSPGKLP